MIYRKTCKASNVLIVLAVAAWAAYILAAIWDVDSAPRHVALGVAGALTVLSLAMNGRQVASSSVGTLAVAVAKAPREAYFRGYGDASQDALGGAAGDQDDTTDLSTFREQGLH